MGKTPKPVFAGIFVLAFSIILFEISLTRVFAVMMWHHFTYMVVSMALLGFGAAGSMMTARQEMLKKDLVPAASLAKASLAYGFAAILAFCFVTQVRLDSLRIWEDKGNILALLQIYLIISVPFVLGGWAVGLALTRYIQDVNRLYFIDLLGSAAGGALSVVLLRYLGSTTTLVCAGTMGVAAGFLFSLAAERRHRLLATPLLIAAAALLVGFLGGWKAGKIPPLSWEVPFAPGKEAVLPLTPPLEKRIHSATAEVEVSVETKVPPMIGGNFGVVDKREIEARFVGQDGTAPTMLYRNAADFKSFAFLDDSQAGTSYLCHESRGGKNPKVLIIGVGGGPDILMALRYEAAAITAVEINTAMIDMVTRDYDEYLGGLFRPGAHEFSDRIRLVNGEGRHYARSNERRYDIIQMSGVDSFTALSTGAYTLSESYLYTVEAVQEFYAKLEDNGYINYSRFILNRPKLPRETLRLSNIARTALSELGISDPAAQICVFQGIDWASTIIKKGPFTAVEIESLKTFAARQSFYGLVFDPTESKDSAYGPPGAASAGVRGYLENAIGAKFGSGWSEKLPRDTVDRLLLGFNHYFRDDTDGGDNLLNLLCDETSGEISEEFRALAFGWVAAASRTAKLEHAGFLQTRDDFRTILKGDEATRAAYLDTYEYDLSPCRDDKPFFFNYYKYSKIFGGRADQGDSSLTNERYHSDFPVGHLVLAASLTQIMILAAFFIFWPIRTLRRAGVPTPGKMRYLIYFSALGIGFMLVEIVLMQKLVIFLGHPTYALSVVLSAILGFAGLGSFLAGRLKSLGYGTLIGLMISIVGIIVAEAWVTNNWLPRWLGATLGIRIAITVALLLPLGVLLGMPFPTGMRIVKTQCPQLLPWTWAINGFCSVFSSIFCIVLSMQIGFTNVLYVAAGIYALGFLIMKPLSQNEARKLNESDRQASNDGPL